MSELSFALYPYRIALSRPLPVGKQRIMHRTGLVLEASTGEKRVFAEIAPLSGPDMDGAPILGFSAESIDDCIDTLKSGLAGRTSSDAADWVAKLEAMADSVSQDAVAWGLGILAAQLNEQLSEQLSDDIAHPMPDIPLIYLGEDEPLEAVRKRVKALPAQTRFVKVKVGQTSMETELKLIHGILAERPQLKLRLDANQGFELDDAIDFCACLPRDAIDYIEEPCRNPADNPALFRAVGIGYALDESLALSDFHFPEDPQSQGLRALVLKPMLLGSPARVQAFIDDAHSRGIRCVISSALESSLGISALAAFAKQVTPEEAPGLDTLFPFEADCIVSHGQKRCLTPEAPGPVLGCELGASLL
ncbi:o-succinylbenzoate synthase [Shewanella litorisediminis]|uniref:o-succinylbenzoate synthase n=1 Tax=Shewanella litorisediminis TaxID=1173586 RepID=A0ABX7G2W8_9GAMM|nr:o-succinylbenzoate synthase [Shewanella litorisediminis]MCL2917199.1 o-succinylbenzoate synthase [Shewanella litorisediminis]QRH01674.1 o-succinylbenzoate synthase [Shewanella litorisediminis]